MGSDKLLKGLRLGIQIRWISFIKAQDKVGRGKAIQDKPEQDEIEQINLR